MRAASLAALLMILLSKSATAVTLAEDMSCEQAIRTFQSNGVIYKRAQGGQVLPIRQGKPIRLAEGLSCSHNSARFVYSLKTRDNPRCVISAYCG
jgi:hypothetical protein